MPLRFDPKQLEEAARMIIDWLHSAQQAVVFTGAGVSTDSGIPDFRSPGGVWSKYRTVYFDEFLANADARHEYWRQKAESHRDFAAAQPNLTHRTLARWEQSGKIRGVITQNIDGLHQNAGSRDVLELHGTARYVACLACAWREPADAWVQKFLIENRVPDCPQCRGKLKHATISFGQAMPTEVLQQAVEWAEESDLFIALGSSLVVEPAASLPRRARDRGARLIILNREPTPLDKIARLVVNAPLGSLFETIERLEASGASA